MLAIIVGVKAEHNAAESHIDVLERQTVGEGYAISRGTYAGKPVLVCRTALGEERVKGIVDTIIHEQPISAILSARMVTGIPEDLRVGDLAFCHRTLLYDGTTGVAAFTPSAGEADRRMLELAGRAATKAKIPHMVGDCVTMSPLQPLPVPRETFAERANLIAADTEGWWLAEAAHEHDVPFLPVRVSLGDVYNKLPETITMLGKKSRLTLGAVLKQNITHPTRFPDFIRLTDAVRTCGRSLRRFFPAFLEEWSNNPIPSRATDQR